MTVEDLYQKLEKLRLDHPNADVVLSESDNGYLGYRKIYYVKIETAEKTNNDQYYMYCSDEDMSKGSTSADVCVIE